MPSKENSAPVELGDGRPKHISIVTQSEDQIERSNVYLRHSTNDFIISKSSDFSETETKRYSKENIKEIRINQYHSRCYITTAVANDDATLESLRNFRDNILARSQIGWLLVAFYEQVSPPIAKILAKHPSSRTVLLLQKIVRCCAELADQRAVATSITTKSMLTLILVLAYIAGNIAAIAGTFGIVATEKYSSI